VNGEQGKQKQKQKETRMEKKAEKKKGNKRDDLPTTSDRLKSSTRNQEQPEANLQHGQGLSQRVHQGNDKFVIESMVNVASIFIDNSPKRTNGGDCYH
jgi:hypothetical protein